MLLMLMLMLFVILLMMFVILLMMVPRPRCAPPCRDEWRRLDAEAAPGLWGKARPAGENTVFETLDIQTGDKQVTNT